MAKKAAKPKLPSAPDGALIERLLSAFEMAKQTDENGDEYWSARRYAEILGYKWQNFEGVIERGKAALAQERLAIADHFTDVSKVITAGKGAQHRIRDIELTRQACYFVGINGDPRKKETIAAVQRYFVEKTRKHEILEQVTGGIASKRLAHLIAVSRYPQCLRVGVLGPQRLLANGEAAL